MRRSIRIVRLVHALAGLLLAALVTAPGAASAHTAGAGADEHVTISHYAFAPASLTVAAGTTVTWTNLDSVGHDVTVTRGPALFHSPMLSQGQSWSYTFSAAGPYSYICSVHPDMRATVTVAAAPAAAAAGSAATGSTPAGAQAGTMAGTMAAAGMTPVAQPTAAMAQPGPSTSSPSISPFLFVAGAACAVLVFALLMLADRPRTVSER
jgi:plastocyanin